jgi:uncharacterized damage-inducible protein DinB
MLTARPTPDDCPPIPWKYARLVPEGDLLELYRHQREETKALLAGLTDEQADYRYAEGKWSIRQVAGHIIDNERIWMYRLLRIARNDPQSLPGYDERIFVEHAPHATMPMEAILAEYDAVREASLALLRHLPAEAWQRAGEFAGGRLTALAAACVSLGHEIHHVGILNERYLNRP